MCATKTHWLVATNFCVLKCWSAYFPLFFSEYSFVQKYKFQTIVYIVQLLCTGCVSNMYRAWHYTVSCTLCSLHLVYIMYVARIHVPVFVHGIFLLVNFILPPLAGSWAASRSMSVWYTYIFQAHISETGDGYAHILRCLSVQGKI